MTILLKKYSVLLIASMVASYIITALIMYFNPHLLTIQTSEGAMLTYGSKLLENGIEYLINIIFVFLMYREMKKMKFMSVPILILTLFSSSVGVIFLFIIHAYDNLITKN